MSTDHEYFATCPLFLEDLLASELESFGATDIKQQKAGVAFKGTLEAAYRTCLWSRIANRVLLPLREFSIEDKDQLYKGASLIRWENIISPDDTFAVSATLTRSPLKNEKHAALIVKDAIADYFRNLTGSRPDVDRSQPRARINLHAHGTEAVLSLDLSGDSLHKRGYRLEGSSASIKENTAAALLYRSGWAEIASQGGAFVDPMCGSATLPIEAALIAGDIAPGLYRTYFGFYGWMKHDPDLWEDLWDEAEERKEKGMKHIPPVTGYDQDGKVIPRALENIQRAGLNGIVHAEKRELNALRLNESWRGPGLIAVNPPYGERLGDVENLRSLYRSMGDIFSERFPGWKMTMITSSGELSKSTGLRAEKTNSIYNGPIKCILARFSLYENPNERKEHSGKKAIPLEQRISPALNSFVNRVRKRNKHLTKWAKRENISCYRIYDADLPDYNVAIDLYEGKWALVQEYAPPEEIEQEKADGRIKEIMSVLPEVLELSRSDIFLKTRRKQKGKAQYSRVAATGKREVVNEWGSRFWVNFTDYLDTGIFLDHRIVRSMIKDMSNGKKFLNLFCYTGTATVHAAAGGAKSTVSVDSSKTYTDWARDNMALNGFGDRKHKYVKEDCFTFLKNCKDRFDLIFLDPPTFSNSKSSRSTFDIQRDHVSLIKLTAGRLEKGGILIFSNNFRKFKLDEKALDKFNMEEISEKTISEDFRRNNRIHRSWIIQAKEV
ncbi:bifunctional 23S rRNA (guanine(2069)-N(7))-methyltransferase RlmK/23S rRNA (guanine(2445)-N(2))-methyltransferase RlmL [Spirochaeta isovalerica]|uniref:Ribosomal RNA large subunit methyltransferase K/L n=1 Tax=Spirochaeta isovalerica TaxID=150 RepID=A0A841R874_9SPIO|nr:bifunctional 23S rRNA (guanine(2069)-N(7))-methyltransferase RlmK/23S rRNA (guanine(2445)-N(2))-methyltransferase RlmL [Spirochaeta isovalerica]MBB6478938.1 23S rRNA (guanine2445-N2)-methyltransferase / 23S rRNA (guanine2069-N7)-methyltransferase [Spirochaeta isovalerica]